LFIIDKILKFEKVKEKRNTEIKMEKNGQNMSNFIDK